MAAIRAGADIGNRGMRGRWGFGKLGLIGMKRRGGSPEKAFARNGFSGAVGSPGELHLLGG